MFQLRGFYPIVDVDRLPEGAGRRQEAVAKLAAELAGLGIRVIQLRAKKLGAGAFLDLMRRAVAAAPGAAIIANDRADIAKLSAAAGVHVGQSDLPPAAVRRLLGTVAIVGCSTHSAAQVHATLADGGARLSYLALGPIFPTRGKSNPDAVVGVQEIIRVRRSYAGILVAIGGITLERCPAVWAAGADAVAVIGDWMDDPEPLARARQYMLAFETFCRQSDGS